MTLSTATWAYVILAIAANGGGYDDIVGDLAQDVTVTITDDDDSNIVVSPAAQQVLEGGQATFNVKLASNPGGTVNFTVTSDHACCGGSCESLPDL